MKKLILFCLLVVFSFGSQAQEFFVVNLKGQIQNVTTKKDLKKGDKIQGDDKLKFLTKDAFAVVIGTERGRVILRPSAKESTSETVFMAKNVIAPFKSSSPMNVRAVSIPEKGINDLSDFFGKDSFVFTLDCHKIKLDPETYPDNSTHRYFLKYNLSGKQILKEIKMEGNQLAICYDSLVSIPYSFNQLSLVIPKAEIELRDNKTKKTLVLAHFSPVFVEQTSLLDELRLQKEMYLKMGYKQEAIDHELLNYVEGLYGKVDSDLFSSLVKAL